jgi:sterol desaturase/sphingolipid hydroxylase (fatty acid hydroxylase superfamily)
VTEVWEVLEAVLRKAQAVWLREQTVGTVTALLLVLGISPLVSGAGRAYARRYASRAFRTDAAYTAFYVLGFYSFFVAGPVYRALGAAVDAHVPGLKLDLLAGLPGILQFLIVSLVMDGIGYGWHRAVHRVPALWAFHGVHHSQEHLTPLTNFRFHAMDVLTRTLLQFVPGLVLGAPTWVWIPSIWIQLSLEALAHSDLGWTYGPFGRVLVSPAFHRVHHSIEPRHYHRNFGLSYSFWDRLFGTALDEPARPSGYGNPEQKVPESFLRQVVAPFLVLVRTTPPDGARRAA